MGLRINTNVEAFNGHRNLSQTSNRVAKSMEKLSSGLRINRAGDDAAGLGVSEKMRGQVRGMAQAQRNAQDGISLVQTAEGAMQEIQSILHRVRELAVQYHNGVNGTEAKAAITTEVAQLSAEVSRMVSNSDFNGIALLSQNNTAVSLQVGANQGETLSFTLPNFASTTIGGSLSFTGVFDAFGSGGNPNIGNIDKLLDFVSQQRSTLGAVQNRLEYAVNSLGIYQENLMSAESRIRDVDMAAEMTNFTKLQILQQGGTAMLAQANMASQSVLSLLK